MKKKDILWTPWRMKYIKQKKGKGCIFCQKYKERDDEKNLILYRGKRAFVVLNLYPYINGHVMVAPIAHVKDWEKLDVETLNEINLLSQTMVKVLKKVFNPDGFNLGVNIGRIAGAGVLGHVHLHIVPRWNGDSNFMTVISETRMMPQTLDETFHLLKKALENEK